MMRSNQFNQIQMNALCCWTHWTVCMHCMKLIQIWNWKSCFWLMKECICCITQCYCEELSFWLSNQNLLRRYKKLFLVGPVNTGCFGSSDCYLSPSPKTHFCMPIFVFYLSLKILILRIKHLCYAKITECTIKHMPMDWHGIIWISADLHHPNEGDPWHLWAKINPDNVQQDFRGWTNEGSRSDYKGVKNGSFCECPLQKHLPSKA